MGSLSGEICHTLFDVGSDSFLGIGAVEQRCLKFTLKRQVVFEWNLWSSLARTLDVSNSLDGLVRKCELATPVENISAEVLCGSFPDVVDEVASVCVLEGHQFPSNHHFEGLCLADQAGQTSGSTGSCKHTEVDFW